MLGNWSLGAYFKEESIKMSYDLLVNHLKIPKERLSVTCFEGDEDSERDLEAAEIWKKQGIAEENIYFFGKDDNWWIAGETGPCGPDTEIFYDTGKEKCSENCNPSCSCGKYVEIWNNVFMQYFKDEKGYTPLKQKNVDTGMGLERMAMLLQGKKTPYELEMFAPTINFLEETMDKEKVKELTRDEIEASQRIIAEHFRSGSMMIVDGVVPSNTDRGYILRRLLRRAVRHMNKLGIDEKGFEKTINMVIDGSCMLYVELEENREKIVKVISEEKDKFIETITRGEKEFLKIYNEKHEKIDEKDIFKLYETYGLPVEIGIELAREKNISLDEKKIEELYLHHQEQSRSGSEKKFKGGLLNHNEMTIKYHTATHLLHKALQIVLGEHAKQKGSNITEERLRFDFSHDQKMTKEQIEEVEKIVNEEIQKELEVTCIETTFEEAKKNGVTGLFEDRYGDKITVYSIGDFSKEVCRRATC